MDTRVWTGWQRKANSSLAAWRKMPLGRCVWAAEYNSKAASASETAGKLRKKLRNEVGIRIITRSLYQLIADLPYTYILIVVMVWLLSCVQLLWSHGVEPGRLLCPCDFLGKNTGFGLPFPSSGDLPDPGIKPMSPALLLLLLNHRESPMCL